MTLGSLFDGSGGFPLAALKVGITPIWASEIEPFPIRVTTKRLPQMRHYGDICKLSGGELPPVDIITFGSPCQDLSVAGKRAGLDGGERSSLFYEAIRVIREMREATDGIYPTFIVWENVFGAFSSNKGEDFRQVLQSICRVKDRGISIPRPKKWQHAGNIVGDGYSACWRTLDAQYWGVPQRRKRIFLVADFDGERAGEILFEQEGLRGRTQEGENEGERTPRAAERSTNESSEVLAFHLTQDPITDAVKSPCINTGNSRKGQATVCVVCYGISSKDSNAMKSNNPHSGIYRANTARTLDIHGGNPACNQGGIVVCESRSYCEWADSGKAATLKATGGNYDGGSENLAIEEKRVRRMMPQECALLQGFSADWCDNLSTENPNNEEIEYWQGIFAEAGKKKSKKQIRKWLKNPHSDSAEYKMWGNGVALPCVEFVLGRIVKMVTGIKGDGGEINETG